ncbi:unnamed protein product [Amoebophrya sp. A120]|nr:unnamed protein product [Amoebophrya sp. A120]|eukprot:GSA120T00002489001.1
MGAENASDVLWAAAVRPKSAGPSYRRRPHNYQPSPPWMQFPRPDYYNEYDRGEKVGHLCRPESATAVMYYTGKLPPQPEEVLTIPKETPKPNRQARPKTAIAAPAVHKREPPIRETDPATKKKRWVQRPQTAPSHGDRRASTSIITINARVEQAPGWTGYVPGDEENVGRTRLQPEPREDEKIPLAKDPPMQKLSKGAPAWIENIQVSDEIKARYMKKFAEITKKPVQNHASGHYTERKKQRDLRKKTIWRGPKEHSYAPPTKPPAICNPRKGIHPEAGYSWYPAPTPAEVPHRNRDRVYGTASLDFSALDQRRKADHFRYLIDPWRASLLGKPKVPPLLK